MLWGKQPPQLIHVELPGASPDQPEVLVCHVPGGTGALRWVQGESADFRDRLCLVLRDRPLVDWHYDPCPTCEQLLAVGTGRSQADPEALAALRQASAEPERVIAERNLPAVAPLLNLLEPGFYGLAVIPYFPTDGQGSFFWDMQAEAPRLLWTASPDHWWGARRNGLPPAFLFPTQPFASVDWERVEFYREPLRRGEPVGGLALHLDAGLSALLDGHHRATAACLEGKRLPCLTVFRLHPHYEQATRKPTGLQLPGGRVFWADHLPWSLRRAVAAMPLLRTPHPVSAAPVEQAPPPVPAEVPEPLKAAARRYPTMHGLAALHRLGGTLREDDIERCFAHPERGTERMEWLLEAAQAVDPERALRLAARLAGDSRWRTLWYAVYTYLAANPGPVTDDAFAQFWIDDDGERPEIKAIVDEYFRKELS